MNGLKFDSHTEEKAVELFAEYNESGRSICS